MKLIGYISSIKGTEQFISLLSPIIVNGSNIPSNLKYVRRIVCVLKLLSHELQHRFRISEGKFEGICYWKSFNHPFQFTIRIPPQHSIWPGCEPLKEVYTSIVGGFLFSYWIAFQQKCNCLFVYATLGTTQESIISRRTLRRYTAVIHLRYYTNHLFVF